MIPSRELPGLLRLASPVYRLLPRSSLYPIALTQNISLHHLCEIRKIPTYIFREDGRAKIKNEDRKGLLHQPVKASAYAGIEAFGFSAFLAP